MKWSILAVDLRKPRFVLADILDVIIWFVVFPQLHIKIPVLDNEEIAGLGAVGFDEKAGVARWNHDRIFVLLIGGWSPDFQLISENQESCCMQVGGNRRSGRNGSREVRV